MTKGDGPARRGKDGSNDLSSKISIAEAAETMQVSVPTVKRAKRVMAEDPEAHEAAKRGEEPPPREPPKIPQRGWTAAGSLTTVSNADFPYQSPPG